MTIHTRRSRLVGLLGLAATAVASPARAQAPSVPACTSVENPRAAEKVYQLVFVDADSIAVLVRKQNGVSAQPATASHGVLRVPQVCTLLRGALTEHFRRAGIPPLPAGQPNAYTLSFFDLHDYVGVLVMRFYSDVKRTGAAPVYIFRKSDLKYMMQTWI